MSKITDQGSYSTTKTRKMDLNQKKQDLACEKRFSSFSIKKILTRKITRKLSSNSSRNPVTDVLSTTYSLSVVTLLASCHGRDLQTTFIAGVNTLSGGDTLDASSHIRVTYHLTLVLSEAPGGLIFVRLPYRPRSNGRLVCSPVPIVGLPLSQA